VYRKARAIALPINSGVPEFRDAIKELNFIIKKAGNKKSYQGFRVKSALQEKQRLEGLIEVNSVRERETYSKMFKKD
jgi:hypothetical protein